MLLRPIALALALAHMCWPACSAEIPGDGNTTGAFESSATASLSPAPFSANVCLITVPNGADIHASGEMTMNGELIDESPKCTYLSTDEIPSAMGWLAWSEIDVQTNQWGFDWTSKVWSRFVVPDLPPIWDYQGVYLFPGLRSTDHLTILQPVLLFGRVLGGWWNYNHWYIQFWEVDQHTSPYTVHVTNPIFVDPGDTLEGYVTVLYPAECPSSGIGCDWYLGFYRNGVWIPGFGLFDVPYKFSNLVHGAVEAGGLGIETCDYLPPNGTTTFYRVYGCQPGPYISSCNPPTGQWQYRTAPPGTTPWCNYAAYARVAGGAQLVLRYQ
jgi:hypothetical protein